MAPRRGVQHGWKTALQASPAKTATLGVLALVFVAVVAIQICRRPQDVSGSETAWMSSTWDNPSPEDAASLLSALGKGAAPRKPAPALPETLARDLFARSSPVRTAARRQPERAGIDTTPAESGAADRLESGEGMYELEGTILSTDSACSMAIISGRSVREGDRLGDFRVEHVGPRSVALRRGARTIVLTMH